MTARALTPAETAWRAELETLFARCPSKRLGMYTVGDKSLYLYDRPMAIKWDAQYRGPTLDASDQHTRDGSALGAISTGPIQIDSCAG